MLIIFLGANAKWKIKWTEIHKTGDDQVSDEAQKQDCVIRGNILCEIEEHNQDSDPYSYISI